jgi:hypothetical protein
MPYADATANVFSNSTLYIPNYASSNYKPLSSDGSAENNATFSRLGLTSHLWSNTAAISSIALTPQDGSFVQYSTFYLYGISSNTTTQNTTVPYANGGDIITTDGSYWYHAFISSGVITPLKELSADVLCIAGGGGGGQYQSGGGGAGGLLYFASQSLTAQAYTVTVGAGGAMATVGSDSQFGALTLVKGGGRGADTINTTGGTGGSGGGGGAGVAPTSPGGSATSGQGNNGGDGNNSAPAYGAGGGGGAGVVGTAGTSSAGGNGGDGVNTYSAFASATSTGVSGYYAGGGGGGAYNWTGTNTGGAGGGQAQGSQGATPWSGAPDPDGGGGLRCGD